MSEKRKVTVDGEDFEVEISPGEGVWEVSIEGRTYSVEVEGAKRRTKRKKRVAKSTGGSGSGVISSFFHSHTSVQACSLTLGPSNIHTVRQ